MPSADDRKLKAQEASPSSPNYFRQDQKEEVRRKIETDKKQGELQRLKVKMELQGQAQKQEQKTRPAKERAANIMGIAEKTGDAKEFVEKEQVRDEALAEAKKQGAPENASEEQG